MIDIADIKASVSSRVLIHDRFFANARFETDSRGRLKSYVGGYSIVFPCYVNGEKWALRCWHIPVDNSKHRYALIGEELRRINLPVFCAFEYEEDGIVVKGESFPTTKMKWVDGINIKRYICENKHNAERMQALADSFLKMISSLHNAGIAHGDLQHGNILVSQTGQLFLVDYDSMYVPSMGTRFPDAICGLIDYQHPSRKNNRFSSSKLDYFSEVVIYTSILGISQKPALVEEYSVEGSEGLLFTVSDFDNFEQSKIYKTLFGFQDPKIDLCLAIINDYLSQPSINDLSPIESYSSTSPCVLNLRKKRNQTDDLAWARACRLDSIKSYQDYLKHYPSGRHAAEANAKIIDKTWIKVRAANTIEEYQKFIYAYPKSRYADEARRLRDDLLDRKELDTVKRARTLKAINDYILNHPLGRYLPEAYDFRRELEAIEKEASAWMEASTKATLRSYRWYLKECPQGIHADDAHKKIRELSLSYWLLAGVLCVIVIIVYAGISSTAPTDNRHEGTKEVIIEVGEVEKPNTGLGNKTSIPQSTPQLSESKIQELEKETEMLLDGMEATKKNGSVIKEEYRSMASQNLSKLKNTNSSKYSKLNKRYEAL
jgi:serine/threonine protein kinase